MRLIPMLILIAATTAAAHRLQSQQFIVTQSFRGVSNQEMGKEIILVWDDGHGTWRKAFHGLMAEGAMAELSIQHRVLSGKDDDKATREARQKYGWGAEPRWAYLGAEGQVLAQGITLPTAAELALALAQAGYVDPVKHLESFCAKHPDHANAQMALFEARMRRAARLMQKVLPLDSDKGMQGVILLGGGTSSQPQPEPTRPLTEAEDKTFWGPCEQQFRKVLRMGHWLDAGDPLLAFSALARHSPLMREACRANLGLVEDLLRRYPSHHTLWQYWAEMARISGARSLRNLMTSIDPVPGTTDFPPAAALDLYVKECREQKAWSELKDVLQPHWRTLKNFMGRISLMRVDGMGRDAFKDMWDRTAEPLVEALLRLGDGESANGVVEDAAQAFKPKNLPTWASKVALRCGQPALAQRWASLKVPD